MYKKLVVKVGTNVLTRSDGRLDLSTISQLVDQLAELKRQGCEVILISSGAVGAARSLFPDLEQLNKVVRRQLLSSVGQIHLMRVYQNFFANYDLHCAQVLATKEDFRDRHHYLNMKQCLLALNRPDIIPIVNENDVISVDELMFTDNDELAAWIASMTGAEMLILLTNVDGIYSGPPEEAGSRLLTEIDPADESIFRYISPNRSSFGRGGMATKFRMGQKMAGLGITTLIANGKRPDVLTGLFGSNPPPHTLIPGQRDQSNLKKWIAFNPDMGTAKVIVNEGAQDALQDPRRVSSLLPIGVIGIDGHFEKGDLVEIFNAKGELLGRGLAQYGADTAQKRMGKAGQKALVHYDHLLMEPFTKN